MSPTSLSPAPRPSNVYYLAPAVPATPPESPRPSRLSMGMVLRLRLLAFWWRLRLTAIETGDVLRRFGRPGFSDEASVLEQRAEAILAAPARPRGPARVIDLDIARARLRG